MKITKQHDIGTDAHPGQQILPDFQIKGARFRIQLFAGFLRNVVFQKHLVLLADIVIGKSWQEGWDR